MGPVSRAAWSVPAVFRRRGVRPDFFITSVVPIFHHVHRVHYVHSLFCNPFPFTNPIVV